MVASAFVADVITLGIQDSEFPAKVPQGIADSGVCEYHQYISQPGKDDVGWSSIKCSVFHTVDADTFVEESNPHYKYAYHPCHKVIRSYNSKVVISYPQIFGISNINP